MSEAEIKRGRGRPKKAQSVVNASPDDVSACYAEFVSLKSDVARLGQRIAAMFNRYEKQGVNPKAIKAAYAKAQKDPTEAARFHLIETEYLNLLGIIDVDDQGQGHFAQMLGPQKPKPSTEAQARLAAVRAHTDGYNSGLAGGGKDNNPHDAGTEPHVKWIEGWHDGYADRLAKNPDGDKIKSLDASRKRREPKPVAAETTAADQPALV